MPTKRFRQAGKKKAPRLIDLKPGEAAALSFVADYAEFAKQPGVMAYLSKVLEASTPRARAIGGVMLKRSAKARPRYRMMAKRFAEAGRSNLENARMLKASIPGGL